jgi:hypothetical protein
MKLTVGETMPRTLASSTAAQHTKIEAELRKAAQFGEKGQLQEAQKICDCILSDFPDYPRAPYYSALTALQMGNHKDVGNSFAQWTEDKLTGLSA